VRATRLPFRHSQGNPARVDAKPIWAQINVTWRCNLTCHYCTEYDNSKVTSRRPRYYARIDRCKELGVIHTDLIGGEPLLHPDIFPLMRHVVHSGMSTGMTTNGFLLTEDKLDALIDLAWAHSDLNRWPEPSPETPKSLRTCATDRHGRAPGAVVLRGGGAMS